MFGKAETRRIDVKPYPKAINCELHLGRSRVGLSRQTTTDTFFHDALEHASGINSRNNAGHISRATRCGIIATRTHKQTVANLTFSEVFVVNCGRRNIKPKSRFESIVRQRGQTCIQGACLNKHMCATKLQ